MKLDLSRATSLFIVKPSSLGDVVHTIPAVSLIASAFPQIEIRWLVNPEWAPLIESLPWLTATVSFPRSQFRGIGGPLKFVQWRSELRASLPSTPDVALDFQGLLRSGLASQWSGAAARVGLSDSREGARFFHNTIIEVDPTAHAVDRYLELARACGVEIPDELPWELPDGAATDAIDRNTLSRSIVLHPFSRGAGKSLTDAQIIQFCHACGDTPVVIAGRSSIIKGLPATACDLTNQTSLPQLVWLMRHAGWVVSVDSGPMHIATAATPRVLGIHTWSDPCKVGPYRPQAWIYKGGQFFHRTDCPPALRSARCAIAGEDINKIASFAVEKMATDR